jgi:hypothetical protein
MSTLDPRWHVPASYDPDLEFGGRVLRQRGTPTAPTLQLLSYVALEGQLTALGPGSLFAWQLIADDDLALGQTIQALLENPSVDRLWCAHAMQLVADSAQHGGEYAKLAWQGPLDSETDKVAAGLMLAAAVAGSSAEKARQFLPKIEPTLVHATPAQKATYALVRAAISNEPAPLDEAYDQFAALDDHFGLAQCALVAYQREHAGSRDPKLLRGYLEHAIYRYDLGRRESWAARVVIFGLLPLLGELGASDDELVTWLQRAATFATGARSMQELASVFRLARRLGFEATLTTLEIGDPPAFVRTGPPLRQSQPVLPTPVAAVESKAEVKQVEKPIEAKAIKKKKAKGR